MIELGPVISYVGWAEPKNLYDIRDWTVPGGVHSYGMVDLAG